MIHESLGIMIVFEDWLQSLNFPMKDLIIGG